MSLLCVSHILIIVCHRAFLFWLYIDELPNVFDLNVYFFLCVQDFFFAIISLNSFFIPLVFISSPSILWVLGFGHLIMSQNYQVSGPAHFFPLSFKRFFFPTLPQLPVNPSPACFIVGFMSSFVFSI